MTPTWDVRLHRGGTLVLLSGALITGAGALAELPIVTLWGAVLVGVFALAYPLSLRRAIRLSGDGVSLRCGTAAGPGGGIVAGQAFGFPLHLSVTGPVRSHAIEVELVTSSALRVDAITARSFGEASDEDLETAFVPVEDADQLTWDVSAIGSRVGPAFLHGAHLLFLGPLGLFRLRIYTPLDFRVQVLPRAASLRHRRVRLPIKRSERDAQSPSSRPVKGLGSDVRELREHVSGDPFKHIAWKATARRRRLIVKEFESDVSVSAYALLDIGPSMRWGPPGATRLDAGIDLVFHMARLLANGRDRFGLCTFDHDVFGFTRASANARMPQEVMSHLMELNQVVHEDFTEVTDDDLVARVARFIQSQDTVDLALPEVASPSLVGPWDIDQLASHVRRYLDEHEAELAPLRRHYFSEPAAAPQSAALRTYCRLRGIDLPYRLEAVPGPREDGIERAVQKCISDRTASHTLVVVTDLVGVRSIERLLPAIRLARAHRHRLVFLSPDIPAVAPDPTSDPLEWRLRLAFTAEARERRETLARALRAQGVSVFTGEDPLRAMARRNVFRAA